MVGAPEFEFKEIWSEKPARIPLYLPLYSFSKNDGATYNGFKLRWMFGGDRAQTRQRRSGYRIARLVKKNGKELSEWAR